MPQKNMELVHIEGIGTIWLRRNSQSRYLRIHVGGNEGVVVTIPAGISEGIALNYIQSKKNWIKKSVERQAKLRKSNLFSESKPFATRMHNLFIFKHEKNTLKSIIAGDKIVVWYPQSARIEEKKIQTFIKKAVTEALRIEAKIILPQRTVKLAQKYNFKFNNLSIKNAKTRWGSCSAKNNINLNLQLMRLPDHLIDYVILHELTHTQEKNHQKSFWLKMESILPGARKIDKELNQYHLEYWP